MGVRPPTRGSEEPEVIDFGIAALAPRLENSEVEFPVDAGTLEQTLDDPYIPVDSNGRTIPLSSALAEMERERFDSERQLLDDLHPVFEAYRKDAPTGWLASIRQQLPF